MGFLSLDNTPVKSFHLLQIFNKYISFFVNHVFYDVVRLYDVVFPFRLNKLHDFHLNLFIRGFQNDVFEMGVRFCLCDVYMLQQTMEVRNIISIAITLFNDFFNMNRFSSETFHEAAKRKTGP